MPRGKPRRIQNYEVSAESEHDRLWQIAQEEARWESSESKMKPDYLGAAAFIEAQGEKFEQMQRVRQKSWLWRLGESHRLSKVNHSERWLPRKSQVIELGEQGLGSKIRTLHRAMRYIPDATSEGLRADTQIGFLELDEDDWVPVTIIKEADLRPSLRDRILGKK